MTHTTNEKAAGAINTNGLHTDTNGGNFRTVARHSKAISNDAIDQFQQAISNAGLTAPDAIIDDGAIHRFSTNGRRGDDSGWYCLHSDGLAAGAFGDWREGMQSTWCAKSDTAMTEAEREAHRQRIKAMQGQREAELIQRPAISGNGRSTALAGGYKLHPAQLHHGQRRAMLRRED